jgi:hypothetical protein
MFKDEDIVVFAGGTNMANMRYDGYLETLLTVHNATKNLHFRNLAWEGDNVFEQFRDVNFGTWADNINSSSAHVVFVQFGQTEALRGAAHLTLFVDAYKKLLDSIKAKDRQIIILSPIPMEAGFSGAGKDTSGTAEKNENIQKYSIEIKKMAHEEGYRYIDLVAEKQQFISAAPYTYNGIHLTSAGQRLVASVVMKTLNLSTQYKASLENLRQQVCSKNKLWFDYWRPSNWAFLNGDRMSVAFSRDWQDKNRRIFPEEIKQFEPMIRQAENNIFSEVKKLTSPRPF